MAEKEYKASYSYHKKYYVSGPSPSGECGYYINSTSYTFEDLGTAQKAANIANIAYREGQENIKWQIRKFFNVTVDTQRSRYVEVFSFASEETVSEALARANRAKGRLLHHLEQIIGDHNAPHDCYSSVPYRGTAMGYLCPACAAIQFMKELKDEEEAIA